VHPETSQQKLLQKAWAKTRALAVAAIFPELPRRSNSEGQVGLAVQGLHLSQASALRQRDGRYRLTRCEFRHLPAPAELPLAIHQALGQPGLERTQCNYVLAPDEYQLLLVEAPDVPDSELRDALRWRIRELIEFPLEEAVIDVFDLPLPASPSRSAGHMMCVVACRNIVVAQKVSLFSRDAARLEVIDIAELALRNIMALLDADRAGVALLHLEPRFSLFLVSRQSTLHLCRRIRVGYQDLLEAGARAEPGEDAHASLSMEVVRSLEYYESQFQLPPVTALYLAPPPAGLDAADLCGRLGEAAGVPARPLDLAQLMDSAVPLTPERQSRCLLAIGGALRQDSTTL